jgi:tRNA (mo5U34)-methyltransferase
LKPDETLLEILACPQTRTPLRYDAGLDALVSDEARLVYPVREGIPILLAAEARPLGSAAQGPDAEALRAEIRSLGPWHHDLEIAPGIRTGERQPGEGADPLGVGGSGLLQPEEILASLMGDIFPNGLENRSLLDCACNAGGYVFAAKQLGAGRCFGFDVREHWMKQAAFLQRHRQAEDVEFAQIDLLDLPARTLAPFDVTLFFGIFYHLPDPVAGLRIAADLTRELLVLNTAANLKPGGDALTINFESDTAPMSGVHRLAWHPTGPHVLQEILRWCGFGHTRIHYVLENGRHSRIQILAAREAQTFAHYDMVRPPAPPPAPVPAPLWKRAARRLLRR